MKSKRSVTNPLSAKQAAFVQQIQRRKGTRALARRTLIVCEDGKSSPRYFHAVKDYFRLTATSIRIVGSGGDSQPSQVVKRAIELKQEAARPRNNTEAFDDVWCVIDGDFGDKVGDARRMAEGKVELAVSTPCFEYWVLLHFEESAKPKAKCDDVIRDLRKHRHDYAKGDFDFGEIVEQSPLAAERAERLRRPRQRELPEKHNPCTEIFRIIKSLTPEDANGK